MQKLLEDEKIEEKFKDLCKEYDSSINLLNFFDCKEFNTQDEDKVLKEDIEEFSNFQDILAESITGTNMKQLSEIYFKIFFLLVEDITNIFIRSMDLYYYKVRHKKLTKILLDRIIMASN